MGIKSWRLQIRQGSGPPLPTSSVSCFAKKRNPRKKAGQELSNISARFKPESPGRCWFLRGGRCLTEVRTGAGRPHVRSGLYCPNQTGEPRTPSCSKSSNSWLSNSSVWRQGNSRSFPELGQVADPFNIGKIQQDNFPQYFTNTNFPWKQDFCFSLNK